MHSPLYPHRRSHSLFILCFFLLVIGVVLLWFMSPGVVHSCSACLLSCGSRYSGDKDLRQIYWTERSYIHIRYSRGTVLLEG